MVLQSASVVFNDSASQFNKDLTDFFKRNLEVAIRRGGLAFQFKIAKPADLPGLRQMGVKRLPAMIINNRPFVGVPDIIAEIRSRVKNSNKVAAEKSEEEIIRDYQMSALGNITKDAEGKFQIHDEPEKEEGDDLMAAFNREAARRSASNGGGNDDDDAGPQNRRGQQPRQPSRDTDREHDDEDYNDPPPPRRQPAGRGRQQAPRADNLDNPQMADAFESLKNISKNATADDAQDDQMMAALLGRMGTD